MAPRDMIPKSTPKVQRVVKANGAKSKSSPAIKKTMSTVKKATDKIPKIPLRINNTTTETRQRTATVPKVSTPKAKDNKSAPLPGSVTKSVKKSTWKRRPKPAHSGVPVPEKMKRILEKQLQDMDSSL